jgi:hypothetical protein
MITAQDDYSVHGGMPCATVRGVLAGVYVPLTSYEIYTASPATQARCVSQDAVVRALGWLVVNDMAVSHWDRVRRVWTYGLATNWARWYVRKGLGYVRP